MTMMNRICPAASPQVALTKTEIDLLDCLIKENSFSKEGRLSTYLIKTAKLGGYLARSSDPPPGNTVMWRGMSRLIDIELGFRIAMKVQKKQTGGLQYAEPTIRKEANSKIKECKGFKLIVLLIQKVPSRWGYHH